MAADVPGARVTAKPMAPVPVPSAAPAGAAAPATSVQPPWVAYDRKVLRFYGYFKETVTESNQENYRVRRCVIYFYLEDQSVHVAEPKQANSGIPQGVFLKRHRIQKDDGSFVGLSDLVVGGVSTFYGRSFVILSCDPFTRSFLTEQGIEVADDSELASSVEPIVEYRAAHMKKGTGGPPKPRQDDLTRFIEAKLGRASNSLNEDKLAQFVEHDGKVLRFFCVWDDRDSYAGERLKYILHYFLADDTIEILEEHKANTGRAPFPVFLKRDKLPLGMAAPTTVGSTGLPTESVRAEHLRVGSTLQVYGRAFQIYACDDFTKEYYKNMGLSDEALAPIDITEEIKPLPKNTLPPYNGFGSLEDSKQNCVMLIAKPPKKNFHKIMDNEKKLMRFIARMAEDPVMTPGYKLTAADVDRRFILQYFLADDTISIFEPPARNSGIIGGKFLERGKVTSSNSTQAYPENALFVGARLKVHHRCFDMVEADEYTLTYMEQNSDKFPMSDSSKVMAKAREAMAGREDDLRSAFIEMDTDGSGSLSGSEIEQAVRSMSVELARQEIVTLVRTFDKNSDGKVSIEEFFGAFGKAYTEA